MVQARFICDVPEKNADLYYATRFRAHDPFIYFELRGKKYLVLNDLEIDRARREADVDEVLSINPFVERASQKMRVPGQAEVIHEIFSERRVRRLIVPRETSFALVDALRKKGYRIEAGEHPLYPERLIKTAAELNLIRKTQGAVFAAIALARDVLKASRIAAGRRLVYRGQPLTSERLRRMIDVFLYERGYEASGTIVSGGRHAIDPHDIGSGPLRAHEAIIIDVFPRSATTCYYGDATRTFCKGRAPEALSRLFAAVQGAQEYAMTRIRAGVNGRAIHESVHRFFEAKGYATGEQGGRRQGFFHGTGHSIGLEIHEEPARITSRDYLLRAGNVMSCEPGLYYVGIGGVRIEDLVRVTRTGCEVLGRFPKHLEV